MSILGYFFKLSKILSLYFLTFSLFLSKSVKLILSALENDAIRGSGGVPGLISF